MWACRVFILVLDMWVFSGGAKATLVHLHGHVTSGCAVRGVTPFSVTGARPGIAKKIGAEKCSSANRKKKQTLPFLTETESASPHYYNEIARPLARAALKVTYKGSHPSCDSPNTSWRFQLGARDMCLVGGNLTCSVPVL